MDTSPRIYPWKDKNIFLVSSPSIYRWSNTYYLDTFDERKRLTFILKWIQRNGTDRRNKKYLPPSIWGDSIRLGGYLIIDN
ncbi:MAG: hypothetical protein AAF915_26910 [Cyanobacteria bacterium P01_D01_bin.50]